MADTVLLCLCTCPDRDTARTLARALVEARLAACVNLLPGVESVYRWQGAVEEATEVQLLIKTSSGRLAALAARLQTLHPYAVPELIAFEAVGGLPDYLRWVSAETAVMAADAPADARDPD